MLDDLGWSVQKPDPRAIERDEDLIPAWLSWDWPRIRKGAAYAWQRNLQGIWSQRAYLKASSTNTNDGFGYSVALSGDTEDGFLIDINC